MLSVVVSKTEGENSTVRTSREITTNSCEVEWRNCEDEALERAVLNSAGIEFGLARTHIHKARDKNAHFHEPSEFFGGC